MNQAFRVGSILGITIRVHVIFLALFALLFGQLVWTAGLATGLVFATRFIMAFGFVLLHEVGHSLAAQAQGIRVYDIVLWPLGGLARLERLPEKPAAEFRIAIAGPAVNFLLVLLFAPLHYVAGGDVLLDQGQLTPASLAADAVYFNLLMGTFNLIPAFPLDGGRVFRALLARQIPYLAATRAAVHVGRSFALVAGLAALTSPAYAGIVFISVFVWIAGGQELRLAEEREERGRAAWGAAAGACRAERASPGARRYLALDETSPEAYRLEVERRLQRAVGQSRGPAR